MMKLVLIVLFSGIVLMDTVSGAPPIAPNCECNGNIQYDRNSDQNVGECLTSINGRYFCYVSRYSDCYDKKWSSRSTADNELWYSFDACLGPDPQEGPTPDLVVTPFCKNCNIPESDPVYPNCVCPAWPAPMIARKIRKLQCLWFLVIYLLIFLIVLIWLLYEINNQTIWNFISKKYFITYLDPNRLFE